MSRTYRRKSVPFCAFALRKPKTQNERKYSLLAVDELLDYGFNPSNRLKSTITRKPTAWDDVFVSSYKEAKYTSQDYYP